MIVIDDESFVPEVNVTPFVRREVGNLPCCHRKRERVRSRRCGGVRQCRPKLVVMVLAIVDLRQRTTLIAGANWQLT